MKATSQVDGSNHVLFAKLVNDEGARIHREITAGKNNRFTRHNILDLSFEESDSPYAILTDEARFLHDCKRARIFVPQPLGVYQLTTSAVLLMEFVEGVPLELINLEEINLVAIFKIVKQLRTHRLVHGDLRRDNFLLTAGGEGCLIDYLRLAGSVERAMSYDLMSAICHLSLSVAPAVVLEVASRFFSAAELEEALPFLHFITRRLTHRDRDIIFQTISAFNESH